MLVVTPLFSKQESSVRFRHDALKTRPILLHILMRFYQFMLENGFDWNAGSENDFLRHHKTGTIPSHAYSDYEKEDGLAWLGTKSKYPVLLLARPYGSHMVEFRKSGEKLNYTDEDEQGEILRGANGLALRMSDDKIKSLGYPTHDETIVAFVNDKPIGFASNEFGTIGVWVEGLYQKLGIGSDLMVMFMKQNPKFLNGQKKIGQMTPAGENMSRSAYRKLKQNVSTSSQ